MIYAKYGKRFLDLGVGFVILGLTSPLLLVSAILIPIETKGGIFFIQHRVGKDLEVFRIFKFRTMTKENRKVGNKPLIGKAAGVTKVGYILRRLKIDELPQLISVISGRMSLVGPRPSVPEQLKQMSEREKERYSVKPGLTGLAQVSGNIHLTWKERYQKDLEYVENISLLNDLRILTRTFFLLFHGEAFYLDKPMKIIHYRNYET